MKLIMKLSDRINDEIADAKYYAKHALKYRDKRRSLADTMYQISQEEMRHAQLLHAEVVKVIDDYRAVHGDPPPVMQQLYDYYHEQSMAAMDEARNIQQMYNR